MSKLLLKSMLLGISILVVQPVRAHGVFTVVGGTMAIGGTLVASVNLFGLLARNYMNIDDWVSAVKEDSSYAYRLFKLAYLKGSARLGRDAAIAALIAIVGLGIYRMGSTKD